MVSGHSYSRALCARILSIQAIASVLLTSRGVLDQVDTESLHHIWHDLLHENISIEDTLSTHEVFQVSHILENELEQARNLSQTAKLWIQHVDRVLTLLRFIRA